ncbi:HVA22-like protein a [Camellia lanceoleosa]|uniref:HVA22-like protein a n=1 Tax=Camellia lanceoleosa TaxID=1840588 RepID=A0ACC0IR43_9ERIC|nr:HVA22-like protein a [Camellia lanceoleosa]
MGIVSFLKLGLKCFFDFLAWPLFALVCPLYASVWAIESNSNSDMRNLVAYWIVFSLISLFELAFVKLIEWLPFWPYMKLMAICWLGIPNFNGACYVYECLIRSCLSVNLQGVIKRFVKHKDDLPLNAESFLAVAERYVKENGSEELEKLIDRSRHNKPNFDEEEIKVVTNTEEKETATAIQSKFEEPYVANENAKAGKLNEKNPAAATEQTFKEPNVAKEDAKAVEPKEKIPSDLTQWSKFKEPNVANKNTKAGKLNEKIPAAATEQVTSPIVFFIIFWFLKCRNFPFNFSFICSTHLQLLFAGLVNCVEEPNLAQTEKKTVAAREIKGKTVTAAVRENKVMEVPAATSGGGENKDVENIQKEWTCAICQVTTTCEANLMSHLYGRKHRATCADLQAGKQANKNKGCSSSTTNQEQPKMPNNQNKSKKQEDKVQVNQTSEQYKQKEVKNTTGYGVNNNSQVWCIMCNVKLLSEVDEASHLKGKRHLSQVKCVEEPNLSQTEKKTVTSTKIEEKTTIEAVRENEVMEVPVVEAGGRENKVQKRPASKNVQKEWTCAVCQATTTCEEKLKSHLYGREHKFQCAELKTIKPNKGCSSTTANRTPKSSFLAIG